MPSVVRELSSRGHEVEIVIANSADLQRAWCRDHGMHFPTQWEFAVPLRQVKDFEPDIVLIGSMFRYYGDYLQKLQRLVPAVVAWIACPMPARLDLSVPRLILTSHENIRAGFVRSGKRSEVLLPCFDPNIRRRLPVTPRDIEVSFLGSISWAHSGRLAMLAKLSSEVSVEAHVAWPSLVSRGLFRFSTWRMLAQAVPVAFRCKAPVFGTEMYRLLSRSWMTVNVHIESAGGLAGNMRMFEATGMGSVLFTEDAPNLASLFEPEIEVQPYRDVDDLVSRIRLLISDRDRTARIGAAGQRRTMRDHTPARRAEQLEGYLNSCMPGGR